MNNDITLDTLITVLTEAGFVVNTLYPYVIVSLENRAVSKMEIAVLLYTRFDITHKQAAQMCAINMNGNIRITV